MLLYHNVREALAAYMLTPVSASIWLIRGAVRTYSLPVCLTELPDRTVELLHL